MRTNMLRKDSNFVQRGRCILCAKEESTRHIFECKWFEDNLNIEMYEEITPRIEDVRKGKTIDIAKKTRNEVTSILQRWEVSPPQGGISSEQAGVHSKNNNNKQQQQQQSCVSSRIRRLNV